MPEWSDQIEVVDLSDEPDLSEDLLNTYSKLAEIEDGARPNLVLDLSGVTYLNSSNIAQMLRLRKLMIESDRRLKICSVVEAVWAIMLLTGLDKVFDFAPDKATAIAGLQIDQNQ
ncbi:MAG: STAS domain-containing protein [Planctomycetota bacterium]